MVAAFHAIPRNCGRRLLAPLVDEIALTEPKRTFVSVPRSADLHDGFEDISFSTFVTAINRCAWWIEKELGKSKTFETIGYLGPIDLRYPILLVAAIKTGYKAFFTSPRNSLAAHLELLESTKCGIFLVPSGAPAILRKILLERNMISPSMPELPYFLDAGGDSVLSCPYLRTFESSRHDPFVVLHTSGSTGTPKPVVMSHGMMAAMDAYQMIPHLGGNSTYGDFYKGTRLFLGFPLFHAASVCCLFGLGVYYNFTCVLPPPVPLTAEVTDLVHIHGDVQGSAVPPSIIVDLAHDPAQLERMSYLKHITYGGGPLPQETGDAVVSKTRILSFMGSTETGLFPIEVSDRDDWEYLTYSPYLRHEFRPFKDYKDLYEFVIVRNDDYDAFQGVFSTFPDMKKYSTGDLYSKHPTKQGYWRSCCRCDDIIAFSNGEKLNPVTIEGVVSAHPAIEHALVNGHGRFQASLLLKSKMPLSDYDKDTLLDDIWLTVQRANQDCPTHGRVTKHLIMFAVPEKPMVKTAKNTVKRKETLELYQDEFDALYAAASHCSTSLEQTAFDVESAESLRNALRQLISTNTTIEDVTDTADLFQQGLDSLQVMTLVKAVNAFFTNSWPGFRPISSEIVYANSTISKLESAVRKSTESKFSLPTKDHEYEMEGYLSRFASGLP